MRYILISGGTLRNKGAQAMVFVAVDELRKRFPNHEILALMGPESVKTGKVMNLDFRIIPNIFINTFVWGIYARLKGVSSQEFQETKRIS